jgi:hypothetical protein
VIVNTKPLNDAANALMAAAAALGGGSAAGLTNNQLRAAPVHVKFKATTGANSSVAATVTPSTTLLASNANRLGATIYNDDTAVGATLYVSLGATCTTTNFTEAILPTELFLVPFGYTGVITGVWSAATGSARITELT